MQNNIRNELKENTFKKLVQETVRAGYIILSATEQIKMKQAANSVTNAGWNTFWWILGTICMPLTTPYIVHKVISMLKFRKNRDSLAGKVSLIEKSGESC